MPTAGPGHISGAYHAQLMFRNSDGYPVGNDSSPNTVTAGQVSHAYRLTDIVSATAPTPTRDVATFRGGMRILGQRSLGVSDFGTFDLVLSAFDEQLEAYLGGGANDTTNFGTANVAGAPNTMNTDTPQLMLALTTGFQDLNGNNYYMTWIYPSVQIYPPGVAITQDGGVNPNPSAYTVIPSPATRSAHGYLFSATSMSLTDGKDMVYRVRTAKPITWTTYIDDGSATSFIVGYRPTSDEHAGVTNVFTKNGVISHTAVSGVSTTTGAITITAGSTNDVWVATIETAFVPI